MTGTRFAIAALATLAACFSGSSQTEVTVQPGIDVLLSDSIHLVANRRVGLLTNQTGIDAEGVPDLTRLLGAGVQVTAIFSPEHGYSGVLDQTTVADTTEALTHIQIFSLFGETLSPSEEMLEVIDVLVVDLQDIGGRPYTYISTGLRAAAAAAQHDVPVLVLDRPNPIGGVLVQGPVRDSSTHHDFIGMLGIPQRHGMTFGEMMLWGNAELGLDADITVVPMSGWTRAQWFDESALLWVRPSPSMPNLESATHYPGLVLFEATNLSVGRGTDLAFRVLGAPWLDPGRVMSEMGVVPGVRVAATQILPVDPPDRKYGGVTIPAVEFTVTERSSYDPVATAVDILAAIHRVHGDSLTVNTRRLAQLLGTASAWETIVTNGDLLGLKRVWDTELRTFRERAATYLLYE